MGRQWTETFPPFDPCSLAGAELIEAANEYWRAGTVFTITPACYIGRSMLGGGTGTITVNGGSQLGANLITAGWGGTNPVLRRGDHVRISGLQTVRTVTADVNRSGTAATIPLDPPMLISPANGGQLDIGFSIQTWTCMLAAEPTSADVTPDSYLAGFALTFRECSPG